ncbi:uncharacterized protein LOC144141480 isoform X2 [Haemaphysalis longicornis]
MVLKTTTMFLLFATATYGVVASQEPIECGLNEEPGDPCARPDNPCYCELQWPETGEGGSCTGCVCKPGFRRTLFGECASEEECRKCRGDPFTDFRACGTACPFACKQTTPRACPRICVQDCFCIDGYVRSSENGTCVPIEHCPPICRDTNMVFSSSTNCNPPSCDNYCPATCGVPGCECAPGLFLQKGQCVKECA